MIKKLSALVLASALAASTAVFAAPPGAPGGFENQGGYGYNDYYGGPRGFGNELNTVAAVKKNASDDQHVTLTGRLVNYLGHDPSLPITPAPSRSSWMMTTTGR